jgi:Flp pilus assembly protein TadG
MHLIAAKLAAFARDNRAVAAVEFALVLPLLLALYLGSVEVSMLYTADRKVATIASTMADLVSRQRETLSQDDLDDYFTAASNVMQPLSTTGLSQVVTLVAIDEDGNATVRWSAASDGGTARDADDPFPLDATAEINQLARNSSGWVVAAEVTYPYQPIVGYIINQTLNIGHVEYFLPRFEEEITLEDDAT